jgi:Helix-turn-helix domain
MTKNARRAQPIPLAWVCYLLSDAGPGDPTLQHVLMTLACHMDNARGIAWPSIRTLASECRREPKTVSRKLREAEALGLLTRESHGGEDGRAWRRLAYRAVLPPLHRVVPRTTPSTTTDHGSEPESGRRFSASERTNGRRQLAHIRKLLPRT